MVSPNHKQTEHLKKILIWCLSKRQTFLLASVYNIPVKTYKVNFLRGAGYRNPDGMKMK
jgi:hypothetical protein